MINTHQVLRRMAERGEVDHVPILDDLTRCDVLLTYQGCGELYPNLTFRLGKEKDLDLFDFKYILFRIR